MFFCLIFFSGLSALAEEGHSHSNLGLFLGQILNFIVLFGGLTFLLRKPINEYLKNKAEMIARLLQQSEELKTESLRKLEMTRVRLESLEEEIKLMKETAEEEAAAEREKIKKEAEEEAERLRKFAREEIEALVRVSLKELKIYAINLSVALAEQKIRERMTPEVQRKLIQQAMDNLRIANESSANN